MVANAQVAVKFWPANSVGASTNWPQSLLYTNSAPPGYVEMTFASLDNCVATNQPAYGAWVPASVAPTNSISYELQSLATSVSAIQSGLSFIMGLSPAPNAVSVSTAKSNATNALAFINTLNALLPNVLTAIPPSTP